VLMLVVPLYASTQPVAAQTDALKTFFWRVRWFLGERATSRLPVETSFAAASTRLCYDFETFGHVINV
jgi:hypothetical protein